MADELGATVKAAQKDDDMENVYLDFRVGSEVYGIEIRYIPQIIRMQKITERLEIPLGLKGFIDLRSKVIPVVNMRKRLGKTADDYKHHTSIVVVRRGKKEIGLIVDAIGETVTIEPGRISLSPGIAGSSGNKACIMGTARLSEEDTVMLIDTRKLLSDETY